MQLSVTSEAKPLVQDVSLDLRKGSMTLVLGEPGCGKSVLLRALAGRSASSLRVTGEPQDQPMTAYVSQHDQHLPTLTVKETLSLSHKFQGGTGPSPSTIIKELGLESCQDTIVGNFMIRGISGGEKRRTTLGEMLVGPARGWLLDEVTTGLDSARAASVMSYMRRRVDEEEGWAVAALLQPPPDVWALFDDVLVLTGGRVAYSGPRDGLQGFLEHAGLPVPIDTEVPDWVQTVLHASHDENDLEAPAPDLPELFANWEAKPKSQPSNATTTTKKTSPATTTLNLGSLAWRQFIQQARNKPLLVGRAGQSVGNAAFTAALFWDLGFDDYQSKMGLLFMALVSTSFAVMIVLPVAVDQRPVLRKQLEARFFPAWAYLLADWLAGLPFSVAETSAFGAITYFAGGLAAEQFSTFLAVMVAASLSLGELFKITSAVAPDASSAAPVSALLSLVFILCSGYVVTEASVSSVWAWAMDVSPIAFAMRALAINEFSSDAYADTLVQRADGELEAAGDVYLSAYAMSSDTRYIGDAFVVLLAEMVIFLGLHWVCLVLVRHEGSGPAATKKAATTTAEMHEVNLTQAKDRATLTFEDVGYSVSADKTLLTNVSGFALPGTVTALMGASGAGKTTLLDVLAGRKTRGSVRGAIRVNGSADIDYRRTGYVEQADVHLPTTTVEEAVAFAAALRGGDVDATLKALELDGLRGRRADALSVSQAKLLTIAVELVADPPLLFLDEPTSGLDARGAMFVMRAVRRIADSGRTVVLTLHQPAAPLVEMLDRLLLLQRGGHVAFFGAFADAAPFVEQAYCPGRPMRTGDNPATYVLDALQESTAVASPPAFSMPACDASAVDRPDRQTAAGNPWLLVLRRVARAYWRTPTYTVARLAAMVGNALVCGSMYVDSGDDRVDLLLSRVMLMLCMTFFSAFLAMGMVEPLVSAQRRVFYRERPARLYNPSALALAFAVVELPLALGTAAASQGVLLALVFPTASAESALWSLAFAFLTQYLSVLIGVALVFLCSNHLLMHTWVDGVVTVAGLFCGVMQPVGQIKVWLRWAYWASPFHYTMEGAITTIYHGDDSPATTLLGSTEPTGEVIAGLFPEFDYGNRWLDVWVALAFCVAAQVVTHWGVHRVNHQVR